MAPDKSGYHENIFLIFPLKHMMWCSLEAPQQSASNEYPQHVLGRKNALSGAMFPGDVILTLFPSLHCVSMTITAIFCSHIIRQKSSIVPGRGPWVAI